MIQPPIATSVNDQYCLFHCTEQFTLLLFSKLSIAPNRYQVNQLLNFLRVAPSFCHSSRFVLRHIYARSQQSTIGIIKCNNTDSLTSSLSSALCAAYLK